MIDQARLFVKAGDGGSGCNSFKGAKLTRSRHPDGGSGGRGADIIIRVDKSIQSLEQFRFKQRFQGENGKSGQANKKKGADARPCIIRVPPGTVVSEPKNDLLLDDLKAEDAPLLVARAGEGGSGNTRTKSAAPGGIGEAKHISLELKLIADTAIIGYPNAGKSSLLAKLTSCRPKIANFPFTTAVPVLAVLEFTDFEEPAVLTLIEIPGLIKGAHNGKGLGAQFLRHAERSKVFIHLIDMAASEARDPIEDYRNLNRELEIYSARLAAKPQILAANKMDLPQAQANLKAFSSRVKKKIYPISAMTGEGIEDLLEEVRSSFR